MLNKTSFIKATGIALFGLCLAVAVFLPASADAAISVDFSQCANNDSPTPAGKCNWIGSILQASNSDYFEGMSVPQRILYRNVETNGPHTISFTYQYTKGGIHAYDFLTTVNPYAAPDFVQGVTDESYVPGITDLAPCDDLSGPDATACTSLISTTPVFVSLPSDPFDSKDTSPSAPGTGTPQSTKESNFEFSFPGGRSLTVYSGGGTTAFSGYSISALVHSPSAANSDTGDSDVEVTLNFTSAGCSSSSPCKYLIFFGGHLAVSGSGNSSDSNWGVGVGSSNISGGPYHIKGLKFDGGGGSLDNQIQGSSVLIPNNASITIIKDAVPDNAQDFHFTTIGTGLSAFDLDDDPGSILPNTQVFSGLAPGTYSVAEGAVAGWSSDSGDCSDGSPVNAISLQASENITCTFTNTLQTGHIIVDKVTIPASDSQSFEFITTGAGYGGFSLTGAATPDDQTLNAGAYSVSETVPAGWISDGGVCVSSLGDSETPGALELDAGETITCTFTNTKLGKILIDKVTNPAASGQSFEFDPSYSGTNFNLTDAAAANDSGFLAPGTYSVSEVNTPAGWSSDGGICVSSFDDSETPGALELDAGETITCTFTNTKLGKILIDKVTNPAASGQSFEFDPSYPGANFFLTDVATPNDSGFLAPGTYSVSEVNIPTGWALTSATCSDGSAIGSINLAAGETVTCTFTNTQNATVIVKKDMVGGTGTFSYTGTPSGSISTDLGTIQASVTPGQYTSTETVPAGWVLNSIVCDDANSSGSGNTATFNAEAGETVTCTFTNTKQPTLTVNKVTVPSDDNGLFNLQIDGSTAGTGANAGNGGTTGAVVVSIGGHTVGETAGAGTDLSDYASVIGGECAPDGTVSLAAGENKTCTITNTKKGHIIVDKVTDPTGDTQTFDFIADFGNFSLTDAAAPHNSGALVAGTYSVFETVPPGWDLTSATCDDGSDPAAIGLAAGETVTCTFNNQKDAFIIVDKVTDPSGDLNEFDFTTDYGSPFTLADTDTPNNSGDLAPGAYSVTEAAEAGWDPTGVSCSDGSPANAIALSAGETVTCTFTNTKRGHIIIQKNAINDSSQEFAFNNDFGNGNPGTFGLVDDSTPGLPSYDAEVLPGTYAVSEAPVPGWESPESASCSDGSPVGAIAVSPDETVTCTFVNEELATIILVKNTVGGNSTFDFVMTGSGLPAGTQLTTVAGTDSETFTDLDPDNTYSIDETLIPSGWDLTNAVCTGTNTPASITPNAGETVTCTFTDTARGKIIVEKQTLPDLSPQSFDFTANYDGDGFALADGGQNDSGFLVPGSYNVAETGETGWDLTSATCNDDDSTNPAALTLDPGETITCAFTNTQRGHLIVQKTTDPVADPTVFDITASGSGSITGGGVGTITDALDKDYEVTPGTYSVVEAPEAGWDEVSNTCSGVVVDPGETEACLITNQADAFIIVDKVTDPSGDLNEFDFTTNYGSPFTLADTDTPNNSGDLAPGTYSVTEAAEAGWDPTGATCSDGSPANAIALSAGETVICTFTNTKRGHITIEKQTLPDGSAADFTFTGDVAGALSDGENTTEEVIPGIYSSTETIPAGWDLTSIVCSDGDSSGVIGTGVATFNVSPGEDVTCVFTNTQRGHIIVDKVTNPSADPQSFAFTTTGTGYTGFSLTDAAAPNDQEVVPGGYSVAEGALANWDSDGGVCDNGETPASLDVEPGETVTCTFTNTKKATLTIVKDADPNDAQDFVFIRTFGANFTLDDDAGVQDAPNPSEWQNSQTFSNLASNQNYTVTETIPNQYWKLDSITCVNTVGGIPYPMTPVTNGITVNLTPGADVTCTFQNDKLTPTRTQGFWQTHVTYTSSVFWNMLGGVMPIGNPLQKTISTTTTPTPTVSSGVAKLFGAFWSNIAKKTTGQQRIALDKARMQLLQQLVAAKLNCAAFGCTAGVQAMIVAADSVYAGSSVSAILSSASALDGYNNSGDTIIIGPAGKADPKTAQSIADKVFWNTP